MGPTTRLFIKTSLLCFALGVVLGGVALIHLALAGRALPYPVTVAHLHLLLVGWFTNLIFGVAYWLFPRLKGSRTPERAALWTYGLLNGGLALRMLGEPLHTLEPAPWLAGALALSGLLQIAGALLFVGQIWRRVTGSRTGLVRERNLANEPAREREAVNR